MIITTALFLLLLSVVVGRVCVRRSLIDLTVEQKAHAMDASSKGNIWFLVCLAVVLVIPWPLATVHIPVHYRFGVLAIFLIALFLLSLAAAGSDLLRLSRLGLPTPYVRSVVFGAILFQIGLLLLTYALIYDVSVYLRH
jgi:hypothetical protein